MHSYICWPTNQLTIKVMQQTICPAANITHQMPIKQTRPIVVTTMPTRPTQASHNSHNVPTKQIVGAQKIFCVNVGALLSRAFSSDPAAFARYGEYLATNKPIATMSVATARSNMNKLVVTASDSGVNSTVVVFQCFFDAFDDVACVKLGLAAFNASENTQSFAALFRQLARHVLVFESAARVLVPRPCNLPQRKQHFVLQSRSNIVPAACKLGRLVHALQSANLNLQLNNNNHARHRNDGQIEIHPKHLGCDLCFRFHKLCVDFDQL